MDEVTVLNTIYVTSGKGICEAKYGLLSFDLALRDAGIADLNHVRVSSIIPPNTLIKPVPPPLEAFPYGKLTYTVYARSEGKARQEIAACLVLMQSSLDDKRGVIFETSIHGSESTAVNLACEMARLAMHERGLSICKTFVSSSHMIVPRKHVGTVIVGAILDLVELH